MINVHRSFISVLGVSLALIIVASGLFLHGVGGATGNNQITQTAPAAKNLLAAKLGQTHAEEDFNGDGLTDVAVIDFVHDTVLVMIGDRAGYFHSVTRLSSGGGPRAIVAADFNRDGAIDLAITGFFSGEVAIFLGRGDGSFHKSRSIRLSEGLTSLIAEDFDSNGLLDLAVANFLSGEIVFLKGLGDGSFETQTVIGQVQAPTLILSHDFDRDGSQDLVAFGASEKEARLFTGEGNGSFKNVGNVDAATAISFERGQGLNGDARLSGESRLLRKLFGDGQSAPANTALPQPLIIAAGGQGESSKAGRDVTFSMLYGDGRLEANDTRTTDERGQASLALSLGELPGNNLVAAAAEGQVAVFGESSTFSYADFFAKIRAALAQAPSAQSGLRQRHALLDEAERKLSAGDEVGAIIKLRDSLELLTDENGGLQSMNDPVDLARRLLNQVLLFGSALPAIPTEAINCGETKKDRRLATTAQVDTYTFTASAGEAVVITSIGVSGGVEAVADLYSPSGKLIGSNSPGNRSTSSIRLTESGAHTILVYDFFHDEIGLYDLNLQFSTGRCGAAIGCGQTKINNNLASKAQVDAHTFTGSAGEAVVITSIGISGGVEAVVELYNPSGTLIGSNSPGDRSASSIALPASGTYTILAYDFFHDEAGVYDINLQFSTDRCGMAIGCGGQAKSGNLSSKAQVDAYTFSGGANCSVIITTRGVSGGVEAVAELYSPSGAFITGNSPGDRSTPSIPLTATGNYTILVYDFFHDETGAYNVSLSCTGACPTTFSDSGRVTAANGTGISGVTMNFTRVSGTGSLPASVVTDQNGNWNQTGFQSGTAYRVTPVKTGCTFNPTSRDFSSARSDLNFTGACPAGCPTARIEILPTDSPAANDDISIRISGDWPDACAPRNPQVTVSGGEIRINTSNPGQFCALVITPYTLTVPVGRLGAGTYQVIVTHSYPGGQCELGRRSFTVRPVEDCIAVSLPSELSGPANGSLLVPITVPNLTGRGIVSYDFTITFDPSVLRPSNPPVDKAGTLSSAMTVTTNTSTTGRLTVSAFGTAPLSGAGTLLFLKFDLIGDIGRCSNLIWAGFRFNEGTPCATPINGRVCVADIGRIEGTISYCISPKAVPGVVVTAAGAPSKTSTTNSSGNYQLTELGSGSYTVTPTKTGDVNGISSFDASLVAQHVAGLITLTSCQQIAGDGSCNGSLSSFDASLIAQFAAGIPNTGCVGAWKFVPSSRSYPSVTGNLTGQNFDAVLVGDVSGNWSPSASGLAPVAKLQANLIDEVAQVAISLPTTSGTSGSSVTIPITVGNLTGRGYVAYDFDITFNNAVLQLQNPPIDAAGTLSGAMNITHNATPGRLRVSAFGTSALTGAGTLLNLKFSVVGATGTSTALTWQRFLFNEDAQTNLVNGRFTVAGQSTPPAVTTAAASSITSASATLNGSVNPNGGATSAYFEWGANCTLSNTMPAQPVGSGTTNAAVSATLSGLTPGTTYCYRLVGTNNAGTTRGAILSFTTLGLSNPIPALTSLSPNLANAGGLGFTLTVNGANFVNGSVVRWNGNNRATTFIRSTQLTAAIPASDLATAGAARVTVFNPAPGGGASDPLTFTISQSATATLTATPTTVAPGGQLIVSWTASGGLSALDWIGLFRVGDPNTNILWWRYTGGASSGSFTLAAPAERGLYQLRYLLNDGYTDVARSDTVTVDGAGAYTLTATPNPASPGGQLTICWTAPNGSSTTDWIGLFREGSPNTDNLWWRYTGGAPSDCFTLEAPTQPGQYEFRYLLNDGYVDVARSNVVAVGSALTALATNRSIRTACAEEDNVNVSLSGRISSFVIEATPPTYPVPPDNCAPDFSNCPTAPAGFPFPPGVFKLFDDGETVVEAVREASWWRPNGMAAAVDERPQALDVHYIRIYRRIAGTSEYPQVLVLYQDGNLRLIPQPPVGASRVCFGSSVIIGPAAPALRPIAEIVSVTYFSRSQSLEIKYRDGGTASIIFRDVNRNLTRVQVNVSFPTDTLPFATFRSMIVEDGVADVGHVKWVDAAGVMRDDPILTFPGGLGTEWFFYRHTRSRHNTSAPDIRIRLQ